MEKSRNIALYLHAEGIARRSGVGVGVCFIHKNGAIIRLSVDYSKLRNFLNLLSKDKARIIPSGQKELYTWSLYLYLATNRYGPLFATTGC